jgi:O-methyltransferase
MVGPGGRGVGKAELAEPYLDLLARMLTRYGFEGGIELPRGRRKRVLDPVNRVVAPVGVAVGVPTKFDADRRANGRDQPYGAETMIGLKRLQNVRECVRTVIEEDVPGDLMEAGIWRGGAVIFMRGALLAYGDEERLVWAADSFEGLPPPSGNFDIDMTSELHTWDHFEVGVEAVRENFARYGLLDERVRFIRGWFKESLPGAPIERLALLRLDADMYESQMDALTHLYPSLSPGGFCLIDDYHIIDGCRQAIDDYRGTHGIVEPIIDVDHNGVYWRRKR